MARRNKWKEPDYSAEHRVWNLAIARIYCCCGWTWQNHWLKNKSDEQAQMECMEAWREHSQE